MCVQSFDSTPDAGELPISRHPAQAYSNTSPPPLGPVFTSGAPQGPLTAGLSNVHIPQEASSAASTPYYTPQQGGGVPQGAGPLTSSLQMQQQQQPALQQVHAYAAGQPPLQNQQQQQHKAGVGEVPAVGVNGHGSWQQQQQGGQVLQGLRTISRGGGAAPVSHQQVHLDVAGAQPAHSG